MEIGPAGSPSLSRLDMLALGDREHRWQAGHMQVNEALGLVHAWLVLTVCASTKLGRPGA